MRILILFSLFFSFTIYSQTHVDIANIEFGRNIQDNVNFSKAEFTIPIPINERNVLLSNLSYGNIQNVGRNYHEIQTAVGLKQKYKDKLSATYLFIPRMRSEKIEINSKAIQYAGLGLFERQKSAVLKYKFGMYVNGEQFGKLLVPLFGLDYKVSNKLEFKSLLPLNARLFYHLSENQSFSLFFKSGISSFNNNVDVEYKYTSFSYNELALLYEIELVKSFVIQSRVGHLIGTSVKTYSTTNKVGLNLAGIYFADNRPFNRDLERKDNNGFFINFKLIYRLHLDK